MNSRLNSLSTELIFEIFDYLSSFDMFVSLIGLNHHFDQIVHLYPVKLNFREISRSKFDFICSHIQPEQVHYLELSEKFMPDQVLLIHHYFSRFEQKFINLKSMNFILMKNFQMNLPCNISSLTFKNNFPKNNSDKITKIMISQQAKFLTYLDVDSIEAIPSNKIYFNLLTNLIINDDCTIIQLNQIFQCLQVSSLVHLKICLYDNDKNEKTLLKFEDICQNLSSLSNLQIKLDMIVSFDLLKECLFKLVQLKSLTIETSGKSDLADGIQWEEFLRKTHINKFNFRFSIRKSSFQLEPLSIFERFRSSFWLKKKHWYVAYEKHIWTENIEIYSLPYFLPKRIYYSLENYPPLSTVPINIHETFFFQNMIQFCYYAIESNTEPSNFRFTNIKSLLVHPNRHCYVSDQELIDNITSFVDLKQIQELDLSYLDDYDCNKIQLILSHTFKLYNLTLSLFDTSLILPAHIHSLTLCKKNEIYPINFENIDKLSQSLLSIRHLQVNIQSKEIISQIIDKFKNLESIIFECMNYSIIEDISTEWFQTNTHRLKNNTFKQTQLNTNNTKKRRLEDSSPIQSYLSTFKSTNSHNSINNNNFTWHIRCNWEIDREKRDEHDDTNRVDYICLSMSDSF